MKVDKRWTVSSGETWTCASANVETQVYVPQITCFVGTEWARYPYFRPVSSVGTVLKRIIRACGFKSYVELT